MKKILLWGLMLGVIMVMPQFIDSAVATDQWKTYKLIKDGALNESKWHFNDRQVDDESVVTMSIEDGRIKFEHRPDTEGSSAWLQLVKCPECVKGIQVEVTMGSSDDSEMYPLAGTVRARIGNTIGSYGANEEYAWSQMAVRNRAPEDGGDRLYGSLNVLDAFNTSNWLYDPVYHQFYNPEEVDGNTYLITMILDREKNTVKYEVEGYGTVTYKIPEKIVRAYETFWGIGTRSSTSDGQGTVWFSDAVNVLVDLDCIADTTAPTVKKTTPEHKESMVSVTTDLITIKFSESMNIYGGYSFNSPDEWGSSSSYWSDRKTFNITRDNVGDLPPDTKLIFTLNPGEGGFEDINGNLLEESKFAFFTEEK